MNIISQLVKELNVPSQYINTVIQLFDEGATVPFIARYRKELTGNLDEVQLVKIKDRFTYWNSFIARKETILEAIESQGKLTPELKAKIIESVSLVLLEDLYLPYKQKRKSKGQKAIDQGLKSLAIFIQGHGNTQEIEDKSDQYVRGSVKSTKEALDGAVSILAEWISENRWVRDRLRSQFSRNAKSVTKIKKGKKEEGSKYKDYFEFSERYNRMASHRILAIFRAEKEGVISFKIEVDTDKAIENIERGLGRSYGRNKYTEMAMLESYKRILQPQFESEIKKILKTNADIESIAVFAQNLKQLLLQSPLGAKNILAIDPGYRTGCKIAILNRNGEFITNSVIYPHAPQNKLEESERKLSRLVEKHQVEAIAIGDGTAGIETEQLCRNLFKDSKVQVFSINEAGASIYSASEIAREEFADLDLTVRGAISIGRRLLDPLAELVKIEAKSIGVGQYQHDVNQPLLKQKLIEVVEHCVNHVGVELNTASFPILAYVSGLGTTLAKNIVQYREENGNFIERKELLKVPKLGKKSYEQSAGFLRIENGVNALDNTIIHPESYPVVREIAKMNGMKTEELFTHEVNQDSILTMKQKYSSLTIDFILKELQKPTRDPRTALKEMTTNSISSIEELYEGMTLTGSINNITNFGAFVNIGLKESGLVHISELSNTFVSNIHDVVKLKQEVHVRVLSVDLSRKRIQLTMKTD